VGLLSRAARGATRGVEFGPFLPPFGNAKRVPLRDRFSYSGIEAATEDDWFSLAAKQRGKRTRIPLSYLHATQDTVASDFAEVAARNAGNLPMIVKERGRYYILDGHHRLTALQDTGADAADVQLFRSSW
jgi:hypothetical protein